MNRAKATWYEDLYAVVDALDLDAMEARCTSDTVLRFGNSPAVRGRAAMREALTHAWAPLSGMRHEFTGLVESGERAILEAVVHYTLHEGRTISIPSATAVERRKGLVAAQRIYVDLAPLISAIAEVSASTEAEP